MDLKHPWPDKPQELLETLLAWCAERGASDLHLSAGLPPYLRIHGLLEPQADWPPLSMTHLEALVQTLPLGGAIESLERIGSCDGAVSAAGGTRFRVNVFRRQGALSIALRRLDDRFRPLAELGLPDSLYELCDLPDGLVIVAGPTGSGKSTTLATLIDRINRTHPSHVITIEDPIEYQHASQKCLVNQRQIGTDASSFDDALVAALRQDPDVILVGEIREVNTIRTAVTASETGHLVFTTVHAGDCVGVVERLVSVFPAEEQSGVRRQLSLVLRAIVVQHLLVADGSGRATRAGDDAPDRLVFSSDDPPGPNPAETADRAGRGSPDPAETTDRQVSDPAAARPGRRRRVVASEILRMTPAVANLIAQGKSTQIYSSMESGGAQNMQTLEQDLARLWVAGMISEQTARAYARTPSVMEDRANRLRSRGSARR